MKETKLTALISSIIISFMITLVFTPLNSTIVIMTDETT